MVSVTSNSPMLDFSAITSDIAKSVSNIKAKMSGGQFEVANQAVEQQKTSFEGLSLNNYAVSYLEPNASFSVQKFASETLNAEKSQKHQKNIFNEDEASVNDNSKQSRNIGGINFLEELSESLSKSDEVRGIEAYQKAAASAPASSEFFNFNHYFQQANIEYAANAYDYVFNINAEPKVLIDYMHNFNRSFDYTI